MNSVISAMPRKKRSYALDERVIDAVAEAARKADMSANKYLEKLLFAHSKAIGAIPVDAEPLGELRGGDTTGKSKGE